MGGLFPRGNFPAEQFSGVEQFSRGQFSGGGGIFPEGIFPRTHQNTLVDLKFKIANVQNE